MAVWWQSSPYYDVGIYLPGAPNGPVNIHSKKHPNRFTLNSTWVSTVIGQGWGIIPIWSGLQPPCVTETKKNRVYFSSDPDTAQVQGEQQADLAFISAEALGFAGNIIYLDIEEYKHSSCGNAVRKYLAGWISEMHTNAGPGSAGVYGNQDVAALDLTGADDGFITYRDDHVTVWGLNHRTNSTFPRTSGLTDSLAWTNKQRIHQYWIDKKETWGGKTYKVDDDLVDATIIPSSQFKQVVPAAFTVANYGSNDLLDILLAIANGTSSSGATPALTTGTAVGVFGYQPTPQQARSEDAYIWLNGASSLLAIGPNTPPYTVGSEGEGINNLGQVVGYYFGDNLGGQGFVTSGLSSSNYTSLSQGSIATQLYSINDAGWILGAYSIDQNDTGCVLYKPTSSGSYTATTFVGPSGECDATGINGIGEIAGSAAAGGVFGAPVTGYIDDAESGPPGISSDLNIFFTIPTYAQFGQINNNGLIAGGTYLFYPDGSIAFNNDSLDIFGVNDEVQMVGAGTDPTSQSDVGFIQDTQH